MSYIDRAAIDVLLEELMGDLPSYVASLDPSSVKRVFLSAAEDIRKAASPQDLSYVNGRLNGMLRDVGLIRTDGDENAPFEA